MLSFILSFISGVLFFVTYMISDTNKTTNSSIVLSILIIIQIIIVNLFSRRMSIRELMMYLLIFTFTIPAIIFDDLRFIQWKYVIFKFSFAIVILISHYCFKVNLFRSYFHLIIPIKKEFIWNMLNIYLGFYMLTTASFSLLVQLYFSNEQWVFFKAFILPAYGVLFWIPVFYYIFHKKIKVLLNRKNKFK